MEGSAYTQKTIDAYLILRAVYENAGIAVQSALKRSAQDIDRLIREKASVRLVKGAYKEGTAVAFQDKKDVDKNFESLMKELLLEGRMPAIATHDERLINIAKEFAENTGVDKGSFEFEMLLGIKRGLQKQLAKEGYRVRVYCPYGVNWLPYTLRRLTERKENFYFVLKHIFD
jgi:proline dehydrogenase